MFDVVQFSARGEEDHCYDWYSIEVPKGASMEEIEAAIEQTYPNLEDVEVL